MTNATTANDTDDVPEFATNIRDDAGASTALALHRDFTLLSRTLPPPSRCPYPSRTYGPTQINSLGHKMASRSVAAACECGGARAGGWASVVRNRDSHGRNAFVRARYRLPRHAPRLDKTAGNVALSSPTTLCGSLP